MTSVPELTCIKCAETKPVSDFYKRASNKSGYMGRCIACTRMYQTKFWAQNRDRDPEAHYLTQRKQMLWTKYRITPEQYDQMVQDQGGSCAICPRSPDDPKNFVVDHDHSCCPGVRPCGKCVRGVLCRPCNTMLGMAEDTPEVLEEAARYLRTAPPVGDLRA